MRVLTTWLAVLVLGAISATPTWAQDSDRIRYYLQLRAQDSNPATGVHDHWGLSLGANLGRYWGLEFSVDTFERRIKHSGDTLGEYGVGLRLLMPEHRPQPPVAPGEPAPWRLYLGIRAGAAVSTDTDAFSGVQIRPEPPAYFGSGNQLWGAALGVDYGRYLGVELAFDTYEVILATRELGSVAEMALVDVIPQLRVRYRCGTAVSCRTRSEASA